MKYIRVYSDTFDGQVFTEPAFEILKTQLCNGDTSMYETKEISVVEVGANEKIHDVSDLSALGYTVPDDAGNVSDEDELTEQSDDEFLSQAEEDEFQRDNFSEGEDDEDAEEGYF